MKPYTLDEIKQIVAELAAQYGAKRVYLFGSCARGDMTDSSDIDLRIDKGSIKGFQLAGLLLDLEDSLGRPVDLVPTTSLDQRFLDAIRDDEVLLYEASGPQHQRSGTHCVLLPADGADGRTIRQRRCNFSE